MERKTVTILLMISLIHTFLIKDIKSGDFIRMMGANVPLSATKTPSLATSFEFANFDKKSNTLNIVDEKNKDLALTAANNPLTSAKLTENDNQKFKFVLDGQDRMQIKTNDDKYIRFDRTKNRFVFDSLQSFYHEGLDVLENDGETKFTSEIMPQTKKEVTEKEKKPQEKDNKFSVSYEEENKIWRADENDTPMDRKVREQLMQIWPKFENFEC